jgi:4-alpha-glucanotransferase
MTTIIFHINFESKWGERLLLSNSFTQNTSDEILTEMTYSFGNEWTTVVQITDIGSKFEYKYILLNEFGDKISETAPINHFFCNEQKDKQYHFFDVWSIVPEDKTFLTSAFCNNIFSRDITAKTNSPNINNNSSAVNKNIILQLPAPQISPEQAVAVSGNQECLGNWDIKKAKILSDDKYPIWEIELDASQISFPLEYKYIVINRSTSEPEYWEEGFNRLVNIRYNENNKGIVISDYPLRNKEHKIKICGTVIPVFSLRTENSFGIGDIGDLMPLVDWARQTQQHIVQTLPVNDTTRTHTWLDSYPYSAISIYALHPLYLSINILGELKDKKKMAYYRKKRKELNDKESLDYAAVEKDKTAYYKDYFSQEKNSALRKKEYREFVDENKDWIFPYAAFCYFRDEYATADFTTWGPHANYNPKEIEKLYQSKSAAYDYFNYTFFIQYNLHKQFKEVATYARKNRVVLKGDLPIGINRSSVEAWTEPVYFNMEQQAGAPPDDFSDTGQNWSFPTYNWEIMEKDGFEWWKKRFRKLNDYFDCFRIDHILGFFRIWEIPYDYTEGVCGHFRPALPLTTEEIAAVGLTFDTEWTIPRIHKENIKEFFGEPADDIIYEYLQPTDTKHYTLKDEYSTQRKITGLFFNRTDDQSQVIRQGLINIANEVLFLADPYEEGKFHPRISAYKSFVYKELSDKERHAFDAIYHDFFFIRHNEFWKETALKRLTPLIDSTGMLVCGEDLGMIPATVHEVMEQLQIFSLELERTPKKTNCEFTGLFTTPYHSVCTTSTHDMSPVRLWWKEDKEKTQRYYNYVLGREGIASGECTAEIAMQIIGNHLKSSSMLSIIPLQDWFSIDDNIKNPNEQIERINIPANPRHYWCYRMHITIEKLLNAKSLNKKIISLL